MINNFEHYTEELTPLEQERLRPMIVQILKDRIGRHNAVTNVTITNYLKSRGINTHASRVRKVVHAIRTSGEIPWLVAGNGGYYIARDLEEMETYVVSLEQRAASIREVAKSLREQMNGRLF